MRIALPGGRYASISRRVAQSLGTDFGERQASAYSPDRRFFLALLKPRDIPDYVLGGRFDLGLAPDEWIREASAAGAAGISDAKIVSRADLGFRMSLLARSRSRLRPGKTTVVTCYTHMARDFCSRRFADIDILTVHGSAEAYVPELADMALDIVETGRTVAAQGLEEIDVMYRNLGLSSMQRAYSEPLPDDVRQALVKIGNLE